MTSLKDFNLCRDPWISVLMHDGSNRFVSLIELFQMWRGIADFNGNTTLNTAAIHHLLKLLILRVSGGWETTAQFKQVRDDKELGDRIVQYLMDNQHLFTIGDPEHPFLQNAKLLPHLPAQKDWVGKGIDWLRIRQKGKKDNRFGVTATVRNPPEFDGIELAQFLLVDAWFSIFGSANEPRTDAKKAIGFPLGKVSASDALLPGTILVSAKADNLRESLLLNTPATKLRSDDLAPWEQEQSMIPAPAVIDTVWDAMTVLTRNTLLLWEDDRVVAAFSGVNKKISGDLKQSAVDRNLLPACPKRATDKGTFLASPVRSQPIWADTEAVFEVSSEITKYRRMPAPQVEFWAQLKLDGLLPDVLVYETTSTIRGGSQNPVIVDTRINSMEISTDIFDDETPAGLALFELFLFIDNLNRAAFKCSDPKQGKPKAPKDRPPLALLRNKMRMFANDAAFGSKMEARFPMTQQFLARAQGIFETALAEVVDNPDADWKFWEKRIQYFKQQSLDLAVEIWNQHILSIPLTTPANVEGVGQAHGRFKMLTNIFQRKIMEESRK